MKINFTDKKAFTGNELHDIKIIQSCEDFKSTIESLTDVIRSHGRILNIEYTWAYNRYTPTTTFWLNGIDIIVEAYVERDDEIRYISATLAQLNDVCNDDDFKSCGYQRIYRHC